LPTEVREKEGLTGQFSDKPIRDQISPETGQLADWMIDGLVNSLAANC